MIKKLIIGLCCVLLLGGVLFGIGIAIDFKPSTDMDSQTTANRTESEKENNEGTDKFSNIEISVIGADIYLVEGDNYSVSYKFHNREVVERLEVSNDTLYLTTDYNWHWKPENGDWHVKVTVPKGTPLNTVNLSTVAGDIVVENREYAGGSISTTSGKVTLSNITADKVKAKTVSGAISVKESNIQNLSAENKTGDIKLYGNFATVNAYSVSSLCELDGSLSESASVETVSGEIKVSVSNSASIQADTYGKIYWNGLKQGYSFTKSDGNAKLTLKSVSGKIEVKEGAENR